LRLTFGPKPIGSRRMSCFGFVPSNDLSGNALQAWVLELVQYLPDKAARSLPPAELSEAQTTGHLMVDHEMDVRLSLSGAAAFERLVRQCRA